MFWIIILSFWILISAEDNEINSLDVGNVSLTSFLDDLHTCACGRTFSPKIVGGEDTELGEFPWQVGIAESGFSPFCGGTLITDRHVVTAAHCLVGKVNEQQKLIAWLGIADFRSIKIQSNYVKRKLSTITIHPSYEPRFGFNDISLITLEKPVKFDTFIRPPCFPRPGLDYKGIHATVIGWGRIGEEKPLSLLLLKVEIPVTARKVCVWKLGRYAMHHSQICAYWEEGARDACEGDSGSPMLWKNSETNQWYVIGIVSYGWGCAHAGMPALYTRFDYFYKWLDSLTQDGNFCTG